MISKLLDAVTIEDIQNLVNAKSPEHRTLDYKAQLPTGSDDDKREFLYDVSSFANASGGDLIYGIEEERDSQSRPTGLPSAVAGLPIANVDSELLRLEAVIRTGISPRIIGIQIRHLPTTNGRTVLIVRIPRSWSAPHMVTFRGASKFYSRTSAGKHPMDVGELRLAFNAAASLPDRVRSFRLERLGRILSDDLPANVTGGARLVLHLIPYSALDPLSNGVTLPPSDDARFLLQPIANASHDYRYNFDGFLSYDTGNEPTGYVQLFRAGSIEAVDARLLDTRFKPQEYKTLIPSTSLEGEIIRAVTRYLMALQKMDTAPPIFVLVSLTGMKGRVMAASNQALWYGVSMIDRDLLLIPEIAIEQFDVVVPTALKPAIDLIWQASGYEGSPNYENDGTWKLPA